MGSGARYKSRETDNGRWKTVDVIAGVEVVSDTLNVRQSNLPTYSSTSNEYFKRSNTGEITTMRTYNEQQTKRKDPVADYDIVSSIAHYNKTTGERLPIDVVHVHEFYNNGVRWVRSDEARLMTEGEIKKYGEKIIEAHPGAKFR